ncbi:MAG: xanthine dehydrogenase family protein molybdopterin-binding subunit [Hyphomicrobiales bacterium]|nr:xanthine dehydrogenase family protein molybdopterin-binding subunit [Hyphomicrobiales bacterium]
MGEYGIGQPVPREEDPYLVRGAGRYVDDVSLVKEARAYVLRSQHSHARIVSIDVRRARQSPGVLHILTGNDPAVLALGLQRPTLPRKRRDGSPQFATPQPLLARERARYIGEPVAIIIAETLNEARDAAELIAVEYDALPAVTTLEQAIVPGAPSIWAECGDNFAFMHEVGNKSAAEKAIASADHVIRHRMVISRLTTASMEPRGCIAEYDPRDDRYTLRCTVQGPHQVRRILAHDVLRIPESRIRVISDNVGGGFGMKGAVYPEYQLALLAAKLTGRPVKWIADRSEAFLSDEHCRDNITEAELALDSNGKFLAIKVRNYCNLGAYNAADRSGGPPTNNIGVLAGTYTFPAAHVEVNGTFSNTMLTGPYRGAGRPEAAYVVETMVDLAARKLGIDPAELRRRNMIPKQAFPYKTALVYTYDCGDFGKNLEDCLAIADYAGFEARRRESARRGKLRGIGISSTVEASNAGLIEHSELRFDQSGALTVAMGTHDHGQGHATAYRQIIADKLGIPPDRVRFQYGDTDQIAIGTGTFGSRSMVCGGTALLLAAEKVIAKGRKLAAHFMEAAKHDVVFTAGKFTVAGTDKSIDLAEVARRSFIHRSLPQGMEAGLFESGTYNGGERTFPNGCHIVEVEIDEGTGAVTLARYHAVDDVGHMINPMLVAGQLHGGIAMGVGQALIETIVYQGDQIVTGSFMDYAMPRADDFCAFVAGENEVPTKLNPLGVKGAGESGTVGALAAVMNAVNDALARIGAPYVQMPATAEKVWRAIRVAHKSAA